MRNSDVRLISLTNGFQVAIALTGHSAATYLDTFRDSRRLKADRHEFDKNIGGQHSREMAAG
tara:strand:- start:223 stop:408 length:186 start_codon:yes stop_codon:yes gene_type:complete